MVPMDTYGTYCQGLLAACFWLAPGRHIQDNNGNVRMSSNTGGWEKFHAARREWFSPVPDVAVAPLFVGSIATPG